MNDMKWIKWRILDRSGLNGDWNYIQVRSTEIESICDYIEEEYVDGYEKLYEGYRGVEVIEEVPNKEYIEQRIEELFNRKDAIEQAIIKWHELLQQDRNENIIC